MKKLIAIFLVIVALVGAVEAGKIIANGATSQSITVVIDNNDGDPNLSVTIADLDLFVQLDGPYEESAVVHLAAHAAVTDAWDDGEAIHMGHGLYRIDIPDANLSNGIGSLLTYIIDDTVGSNRTTYYEVQLSPRVDANTVAGNTPIPDTRFDAIAEEVWEDPNAATIVAMKAEFDPNIAAILEDTGELQTNQGAWATATGFATSGALTTHDGKLDTVDDYLDTEIAAILDDTGTAGVVIVDGGITAAKIGADAITEAKIADNAIAAEHIAANAIGASEIAAGAIDADALATDAVAEIWAIAMEDLAATPGVTAEAVDALNFLFMIARNKITTTTSEIALYKNDAATKMAEADISDSGGTFTKGEYGTPD